MDNPKPNHDSKSSPGSSPFRGALVRGGFWVVTLRCVALATSVLVNVALARLLTHEDFGLFILFRSIIAFGAIWAMFGLDTVILRLLGERLGVGNTAQAKDVFRLATRLFLAAAFATGLAFAVVFIFWIRPLLDLPDDWSIMPLVMISIMALAGVQYAAESLRSMNDIRLASLLSGQIGGPLGAVSFLTVFLLLSLSSPPTLLATLGLNALVLLVALGFAAFGVTRIARRVLTTGGLQAESSATSSLSPRAIFLTCLPAVLIQSLAFLVMQGDLWIAGFTLSRDELALYGAARRLLFFVGLPLEMLTLTVVSMIPRLHARREHAALQTLLTKSARIAGIPSFAAALFLLVMPGFALSTVFGPFFAAAAIPLMILSLGQLAFVWAGTCGVTLMMTGRQNVVLPVSLLSGLALFAIGPIAAHHAGMLGLAAVSTAILIAQQVAYWLLAGKLLGLWTHFTLPPSLYRGFAASQSGNIQPSDVLVNSTGLETEALADIVDNASLAHSTN